MTSIGVCLTKISTITLKRFKKQPKSSSNSRCRQGESIMRRRLMRKSKVSRSIWHVRKWWKESVGCRKCMKMKKRRQRDSLKLRLRRKQNSRNARISIRWEEIRYSNIFKRGTNRNYLRAKSTWNLSSENMDEVKNSSKLFWVKRSRLYRIITKIFWESVKC